jgi:hypothetical protein
MPVSERLLVILFNPISELQHALYPQSAASQEHAPTPYFFIVFTSNIFNDIRNSSIHYVLTPAITL